MSKAKPKDKSALIGQTLHLVEYSEGSRIVRKWAYDHTAEQELECAKNHIRDRGVVKRSETHETSSRIDSKDRSTEAKKDKSTESKEQSDDEAEEIIGKTPQEQFSRSPSVRRRKQKRIEDEAEKEFEDDEKRTNIQMIEKFKKEKKDNEKRTNIQMIEKFKKEKKDNEKRANIEMMEKFKKEKKERKKKEHHEEKSTKSKRQKKDTKKSVTLYEPSEDCKKKKYDAKKSVTLDDEDTKKKPTSKKSISLDGASGEEDAKRAEAGRSPTALQQITGLFGDLKDGANVDELNKRYMFLNRLVEKLEEEYGKDEQPRSSVSLTTYSMASIIESDSTGLSDSQRARGLVKSHEEVMATANLLLERLKKLLYGYRMFSRICDFADFSLDYTEPLEQMIESARLIYGVRL